MHADRPSQQIIGEAPVFLEMLEHVSRAAPLGKPVLVVSSQMQQGEHGPGPDEEERALEVLRHFEDPQVRQRPYPVAGLAFRIVGHGSRILDTDRSGQLLQNRRHRHGSMASRFPQRLRLSSTALGVGPRGRA